MAAKKAIDERFKKFGIVSFTGTTKVNEFIDLLESGQLSGTKCNLCGEYFFPPRADCCHCLSGDISWFNIDGYGVLVSYSTLKFAPRGFERDLPYSIALLDFGRYKVFGRFDDSIDLSGVVVGMRMKVSVKYLENKQLSYVFQRS